MRFAGKVVIVTGGGSGAGEATSRLFAKEGAKVVLADIVPERVAKVAESIKQAGGEATGVVADLRQQSEINRIVDTTVRSYAGIDILVNNAAVLFQGGLLDTPDEEWERMYDTNVRAVYRLSRAVVPHMVKRGKGKIVNLISTAAFIMTPKVVAYATSKGAVLALTRAMAVDLIRQKIWVNAVSPGCIRSNINPARPAETREPHYYAPGIPIGYCGEPEDHAKVILFLASEDADYMVGQCLRVDGGTSVVHFSRYIPCYEERATTAPKA